MGRFLSQVASDKLFTTDFSFHSIGITMQKLNRLGGFLEFVDDAYQSVAAAARNLILISFDSDFDRVELKRKIPSDLL
ncbi:MAG: hypothetical protein ACLP05_09605 [Candidatus Kryptoniota bacterium]